MRLQEFEPCEEPTLPTVKIGVSRQVVIPKEILDRLGLAPGDYLDVSVRGHQVVFTPERFVDNHLAEAFADVGVGRVHGPFKSAAEMLNSLSRKKRATKSTTP